MKALSQVGDNSDKGGAMQKGAANSRPQIFVGNHRKMLRDISDSLHHLRVNQPSDSSGSGAQLSQNGNHANGSNSGGGGDGVRLQTGGDKSSRRAFGGHKDKLDIIRNSLPEPGLKMQQYHHQQPSPIPYDEVSFFIQSIVNTIYHAGFI